MKEKGEIAIKFGRHVKKLRTEHKLTGSELARRCFMERHHILRLERGETNPTLYTLVRIAQAMDIPLEELVKGFKY